MRNTRSKISTLLLTGLLLAGLTLVACLAPGSKPTVDYGDAVLMPVAGDPTVSLTVWIKTGSAHDPAGKEGLAELTGSLISDGATSENSYEEILALLYPMASGYGVQVDKEMTTLSGRTHVDNVEKFFSLFQHALLKPAFTLEDFQRLRSDQLNYLETNLRYASDEELGKAALMQLIYEDTPYAHPTSGTVQGLKSITVEDVKAFYGKHYNRSNVTFAIAGGYDDALLAKLAESIDLLPEGEATPAPVVVPAAIDGRHVRLVSKENADASISFGFPISVRRGSRDFYALWIANSWLGEHRNSSSHLYKVIREKRGMNYGDYSYIEIFPQGGRRQMPPTNVARNHQIFQIWIRTLPNENAIFSLRAALRELQMLIEDGMSEEEFDLTRSFLSKYSLHFAETTAQRLGYAVDDRFYGIDGEGHLARFRQLMGEISREEVNAALKKYLQVDNMKIAMITGQAEEIQKTMIGDLPSPPSYQSEKKAEILEEDKEIISLPLMIDASNLDVVDSKTIFEGASPSA
jgi:zinc protease